MTAGLPVGISAWPRHSVNLLLTMLILGYASQAAAITDRARPDISITTPTSDSTFNTSAALLTLAGVASDDVGVSKVVWNNSRGGRGTAIGTSNWSAKNIKLKTGSNTINVRAYDARGRSRRAQLNVTYTATAAPVPAPAPAPVPVPAPVNQPPTISGVPVTSVQSGAAWSFTPTASDPEGKPLSFSVMGAPSWTSVNNTTGRLSGTPGPNDVGTTAGIVITVSDGTGYASLPAFTLVVKPNTSGTALVSWLPPTQRTDGSPLGNLAGYHLYYGTKADALTKTVALNNSGLSSYMVEGLSTGTWYFAVVACDSNGLNSALSAIASKQIL